MVMLKTLQEHTVLPSFEQSSLQRIINELNV